mgnify:CR=1 FL=1
MFLKPFDASLMPDDLTRQWVLITQEKITSSLIGNLMGLNLIPNKIPTSVMVGKVRLFPMSFLLGIINSQFWKLV